MEPAVNPALDVLLNRRSLRKFAPQPLSADEKDLIQRVAMRAPTVGNMMLYAILEVDDPALKERLVETCDHDTRGRVTGERTWIPGGDPAGALTQWSYNSADLAVTQTYPDNEVVTTGYLPQLAVNSLSGTNAYVGATSYDAAGRVKQRSLSQSMQTKYSYYSWDTAGQGGRLHSINSTNDQYQATLQNLEYHYDGNGSIDWIKDLANGGQQQSFTYDSANRLTSAQAAGGNRGNYTLESYAYDPSGGTGNLTAKNGQTLGYATQNANCPEGALTKAHAATSKGGNSYCYDQNGNQRRRSITAGSTTVTYTLTYDAENRLTGVSWSGGSAAFVYNGDGLRVKSVITSGTTTTTYYVGNHYEVGNAGVVTKYYSAGGQRVAMRRGTEWYYLFTDHLGSTSATWKIGSAVLEQQGYKPWGEVRTTATNDLDTNYTYTGQMTEESFGLMYYNARWYDRVGRLDRQIDWRGHWRPF